MTQIPLIEVDTLFTGINRRMNYQNAFLGFFVTANRSDEILEVGAIDIPLQPFSLN